MSGWIGVDLDGTLALYDHFQGADQIGEPIWPMVNKVKAWLDEGRDVRIFTARVFGKNSDDWQRRVDANNANRAIEKWCKRYVGCELPVTCVKDYGMIVLYDDRCVQVEKNTGKILGDEIQLSMTAQPSSQEQRP